MNRLTCLFLILALSFSSGAALAEKGKKPRKGLNPVAMQELRDAGVDKYLGQFTPVSTEDVGDGWTKHTFSPDYGYDSELTAVVPSGPVCIAGTDYSVFTREGNPSRLLILEQGGGACWDGFYFCNIVADVPILDDPDGQAPPAPRVGIWDFDSKDNPFADYSIVYMPYCDGSVFTGDNDVIDPAFGEAIGVPEAVVRFHRGLRNQSAGMDVARAMFPHASRITVAGSSAGGVGAAGFAPFLARMLYGNQVKLTVFNDAGPVAINLANPGVAARADDWQFGQFYPASCETCNPLSQGTEIIKWRLANDSTIREAFYSTDFDGTNRFFMGLLPGPNEDPLISALIYRALIIDEHGQIHDQFPDRYKRFIQAFKFSHTALQTDILYDGTANGVPLNEWVEDFLVPRPFWEDIVEELPLLP